MMVETDSSRLNATTSGSGPSSPRPADQTNPFLTGGAPPTVHAMHPAHEAPKAIQTLIGHDTASPPPVPRSDAASKGTIYEFSGKYARGAVLFAFEALGGAPALAGWAEDNKTDFYTKLFPKIIQKEAEVSHRRTVDDLMDIIDGDFEDVSADPFTDPPAPSDPFTCVGETDAVQAALARLRAAGRLSDTPDEDAQ